MWVSKNSFLEKFYTFIELIFIELCTNIKIFPKIVIKVILTDAYRTPVNQILSFILAGQLHMVDNPFHIAIKVLVAL